MSVRDISLRAADQLIHEAKRNYKAEDAKFLSQPPEKKLEIVTDYLSVIQKTIEINSRSRVTSFTSDSKFVQTIKKFDSDSHNHITLKFDWKKALEKSDTEKKSGKFNRGDALLSREQLSFVTELPMNQAVVLFHKILEEGELDGVNLVDILLQSRQLGISFRFYTVIVNENLIIASVDMQGSLVLCAFVFSYVRPLDYKNSKESEEKEITPNDLLDDCELGMYLKFPVNYKTRFYYLCDCIRQ